MSEKLIEYGIDLLLFFPKLWFALINNIFQIMFAGIVTVLLVEGLGREGKQGNKILSSYFEEKKYGLQKESLFYLSATAFVYYIFSETNFLLTLYEFYTEWNFSDAWTMWGD